MLTMKTMTSHRPCQMPGLRLTANLHECSDRYCISIRCFTPTNDRSTEEGGFQQARSQSLTTTFHRCLAEDAKVGMVYYTLCMRVGKDLTSKHRVQLGFQPAFTAAAGRLSRFLIPTHEKTSTGLRLVTC